MPDQTQNRAERTRTLIEQPTYEIGRRAADLLLRRIAGENFPPQRIVLPAALRVRKSSQRTARAV